MEPWWKFLARTLGVVLLYALMWAPIGYMTLIALEQFDLNDYYEIGIFSYVLILWYWTAKRISLSYSPGARKWEKDNNM